MFAIFAFACFLLMTFGVSIAGHSLLAPGLAFLALHLVVGLWPFHRGNQ